MNLLTENQLIEIDDLFMRNKIIVKISDYYTHFRIYQLNTINNSMYSNQFIDYMRLEFLNLNQEDFITFKKYFYEPELLISTLVAYTEYKNKLVYESNVDIVSVLVPKFSEQNQLSLYKRHLSYNGTHFTENTLSVYEYPDSILSAKSYFNLISLYENKRSLDESLFKYKIKSIDFDNHFFNLLQHFAYGVL